MIKKNGVSKNTTFKETRYEGELGGIKWEGLSTYQQKRSTRTRHATFRYFKWKTSSVQLGNNKFLMIMSLPDKIKLQAPQQSKGFMSNMVNKLAEVMLDMYVGSFFGEQYKSMINIGDSQIIQRSEADDFFMLTNAMDESEKFLEKTEPVIRKWKSENAGFSSEKMVDAFGILFGPDEMIVSIQTSLDTQEEVDMLAAFASALGVGMNETLSE
jgi:hypothetical protein